MLSFDKKCILNVPDMLPRGLNSTPLKAWTSFSSHVLWAVWQNHASKTMKRECAGGRKRGWQRGEKNCGESSTWRGSFLKKKKKYGEDGAPQPPALSLTYSSSLPLSPYRALSRADPPGSSRNIPKWGLIWLTTLAHCPRFQVRFFWIPSEIILAYIKTVTESMSGQ